MNKISRPTLLISEDIARNNIHRMVVKTGLNNVELIPHFKTHQSRAIGSWFKEETLETITVSSVSMAEYFADDIWKRITIAFPVNLLELAKISALAAKVQLTVLVTGVEQIQALLDKVDVYLRILIEVDTGSNRSGVDPEDDGLISDMINLLENRQHQFKGFYSHFGHTYHADSRDAVKQIYSASINIMEDLKHRHAYAQPTISIGDTPSISIIKKFEDIKSIHAGNFVFYDLTQVQIGSCQEEDIAIVLACPVVSKNESRKEVIIYGGGVHLSKESLFDNDIEQNIYGKPVLLTDAGWSSAIADSYVKSLSQEHGVVKLNDDAFDKIKVGDVIGILPVHSCMTADCMGGYVDLNGHSIDHFKSQWVTE